VKIHRSGSVADFSSQVKFLISVFDWLINPHQLFPTIFRVNLSTYN